MVGAETIREIRLCLRREVADMQETPTCIRLFKPVKVDRVCVCVFVFAFVKQPW